LKSQSLPPSEIIISVNALDKSGFIDNLIEAFPELVIIDSTKKLGNISYARNNAVSKSKSKYVVFVDDDTILGNIQQMAIIFFNIEGFDFACGAKRLWAPNNWERNITELDPITHTMTILDAISIDPLNISRRNNMQRLSNYSFIGNFGIISKDTFNDAGGFDEKFIGWGYEDADLMQELLHRNKRFLLLNSLSIKCYHLSHHTDKTNVDNNIQLYNENADIRGRRFKINHLFGVFENDGYNLTSLD